MSYLRYLCLFACSGVRHILCCGFVFLCLVYHVHSFSRLSICDCAFSILQRSSKGGNRINPPMQSLAIIKDTFVALQETSSSNNLLSLWNSVAYIKLINLNCHISTNSPVIKQTYNERILNKLQKIMQLIIKQSRPCV